MRDRSASLRTVGAILVGLYALFTLFPVYWALNTSLKDINEVYANPPTFVPRRPTLESYVWVFSSDRGLPSLLHSIIVASASTFLAVLLGTVAGYAFSRFPHRTGGQELAFYVLSTRMFPPIVMAVPLYFLLGRIGLHDTYPGLILVYLTFNLPLAVWLMRSFFDDIPKAIEDAARVDGYSMVQAFRKMVFPLALPGVVATTTLCWIFAWNEFLFAFILAGFNVTTVPVVIPTLTSGTNILWNRIMALSAVAMVPPALVLLSMRRYIVRGLTLGAVKG